MANLNMFDEVVAVDAEFQHLDGNHPIPVCIVAHALRADKWFRIFVNHPGARPACPLPFGDRILYVAYAAHAEWNIFLELCWPIPTRILDLYAEFKWLTSGLVADDGSKISGSLLSAMSYHGLDAMLAAEKQEMRNLILRGHPYTLEEVIAILDYCARDVQATERLLEAMLPSIDLPCALVRGRYTPAVAKMERAGIATDVELYTRMEPRWGLLKREVVESVEADNGYGVYDNMHFKEVKFEALIQRLGALDVWPRTKTGKLSHGKDSMKLMVDFYPVLEPLQQVMGMLEQLDTLGLKIGHDGRSRYSVMPFSSVTGRNYPKPAKQFIFAGPRFLRGLIRPEIKNFVTYVDLKSCEFGIAGYQSQDRNMIRAYTSGDQYLAFAAQAGLIPARADGEDLNRYAEKYARERDMCKTVVLGVQYGMWKFRLASRLGVPLWQAERLLTLHHKVYAEYWDWNDTVLQRAFAERRIETEFGWQMHVTSRTKANTISNFPMQGNGAEIFRLTCCLATEKGIDVQAPVQDALLIGGSLSDQMDITTVVKSCFAEASMEVLEHSLLTDEKSVRYPDRYMEKKGVPMWNRVMSILEGLPGGSQGSPGSRGSSPLNIREDLIYTPLDLLDGLDPQDPLDSLNALDHLDSTV